MADDIIILKAPLHVQLHDREEELSPHAVDLKLIPPRWALRLEYRVGPLNPSRVYWYRYHDLEQLAECGRRNSIDLKEVLPRFCLKENEKLKFYNFIPRFPHVSFQDMSISLE